IDDLTIMGSPGEHEGEAPTTIIRDPSTTDDGPGNGGDRNDGALMVNGARRVWLINLTVENGYNGVVVHSGGSASANSLTARSNRVRGFRIDTNGNLTCVDQCNATDNADAGYWAAGAGRLVFPGGTHASQGNRIGMQSTLGGSIQLLDGPTFTATRNGTGISALSNSTVALQGIVNVSGTTGDGIVVGTDAYLTNNAVVTVTDSGRNDLVVFASGFVEHFGGAIRLLRVAGGDEAVKLQITEYGGMRARAGSLTVEGDLEIREGGQFRWVTINNSSLAVDHLFMDFASFASFSDAAHVPTNRECETSLVTLLVGGAIGSCSP
ncbi:MAG: hypothetical protein R3330_20000, partial [Saprospiraceae bacterium]|nr:hypothetical protein [Saprospiraceae bacterium]